MHFPPILHLYSVVSLQVAANCSTTFNSLDGSSSSLESMLFLSEADRRWSDWESLDVELLVWSGMTLSIMLSLSSIRFEIDLVSVFKLSDDVAFCWDKQQLTRSVRTKKNRRSVVGRFILIGGGVFLLGEKHERIFKSFKFDYITCELDWLDGA